MAEVAEKKKDILHNFNPIETRGKIITCKAAVVYGPEEAFKIEQIEVHPPQKMEVRIKIIFTSICHSDVYAWKGLPESSRTYPRILGHEASGIVESVGEGVNDVKEGDYVVPIFYAECGECKLCTCDQTNMCETLGYTNTVMISDGKTRFYTTDAKPIFHFINTSTFSEYTVVHSSCVVKLPSVANDLHILKRLTLLSCGVTTGVGSAWKVANVHSGSTVAIFGLGSVGLAVAEGARARGASKIIGVDINPDKFIKAEAMGVTEFINPKDEEKPVYEKIREMSEGGVHYSFECSGNLDVLRDAFLSSHEGWGLTVLVGIHLTPKTLPIHPMELFNGRRIVGSMFGGFKGKSQLPHFAQQCLQGVVKLDEFISHELPFDDINEAFHLLITGKSLRCILHL